eukprot:COSAG02_NODE_5947_length_3920_cov_193.826076_2_plen_1088_part_01
MCTAVETEESCRGVRCCSPAARRASGVGLHWCATAAARVASGGAARGAMEEEQAAGDAGASPYDILEDLLSGYDEGDDAADPQEEDEQAEDEPELGASPPGDEFAALAAVLGDVAPEQQPEPPPVADRGVAAAQALPQPAAVGRAAAAEAEAADEAAAIEEQLSDAEVRRVVLDKSVEDWCRTELGAAHAVHCLAALQQALVETVGDALFLLPSAAAVRAELQLPPGAGVALWEALGPYAEMMASGSEADATPAGEEPEQAPGQRAASASTAAGRRAHIEQRLPDEEAAQVLRDEQERRVEWLSRVPIFRAEGVDGNGAFMDDLARKLEGRTLRSGVMIIEKGTIGNEMYFIARGEAEVLADYDAEATPSPDAHRSSASRLGTLGEGAFCGEGALLEDERRNAYVVVKSSTVKLLALSRKDLLGVLHSHPEVEKAIRELVDERRKAREEHQLAEAEHAGGAEDEATSGGAVVPIEVAVNAEAQELTQAMYDSTRLDREEEEHPNGDRTGTTGGAQDDLSARLEAAWSGLEAAVEEVEEELEVEEQKQQDVGADSGTGVTAGRGTDSDKVSTGRREATGKGKRKGKGMTGAQSTSASDFGTRMHEKEKQRQRRIRQKQEEMEEAKRRAAPPVHKIHTKNFTPKHAVISDSAARDAGSRLHQSALENRRKVEQARLAREREELAVAKAAVPKTNAKSKKFLAGASRQGGRADVWSELSRRRRKDEDLDVAAWDSNSEEHKVLSPRQLEDFVTRQQHFLDNREHKRRQAVEEKRAEARELQNGIELGFGGTSQRLPSPPDGHGPGSRNTVVLDDDRRAAVERLVTSRQNSLQKFEHARAARDAAEEAEAARLATKAVATAMSPNSARLASIARDRSDARESLSDRRLNAAIAVDSSGAGGLGSNHDVPHGKRRKPANLGDRKSPNTLADVELSRGLPTGSLSPTLSRSLSPVSDKAAFVDALAHHRSETEPFADLEKEKDLYIGFSPRQLAAVSMSACTPPSSRERQISAATSTGAQSRSTRSSRGARQLRSTNSLQQHDSAESTAQTAVVEGPDQPRPLVSPVVIHPSPTPMQSLSRVKVAKLLDAAETP